MLLPPGHKPENLALINIQAPIVESIELDSYLHKGLVIHSKFEVGSSHFISIVSKIVSEGHNGIWIEFQTYIHDTTTPVMVKCFIFDSWIKSIFLLPYTSIDDSLGTHMVGFRSQNLREHLSGMPETGK